ncbi:xanthine phosphoribosyltransferase [Lactococcus kimchii]|uniref:xanthine phosphoribosyltransferase n=1 Tax=Lactococcus sp. S-13 TaxID=2507158 RepID=UPI001022F6C7|nr:xanthine phosphoribosyltransferase [Lactococcus sp. S-13]RZI48170.1 xanthine phosphoribosyltransferase [Lactococcus sp. S-13]
MKLLEDRIHTDGQVLGEDILKVDRFLTHQVDYALMRAIGERFAAVYAQAVVTKVVTIEASGIAPALYTAEALQVPLVFAKKAKNVTMNDELLSTEVYSFTKKLTSTVQISKKLIEETDKILIIDDFLANGQAALGLLELMHQAGADVAGMGIVIEKSFQNGRQQLLEKGIKLTSLARIAQFENGQVRFALADDLAFD